ncbi:MAG TPA: ABC transporter permease, partial [Dongiaceae bacterium]|nr:ABC transporter permease [Dongiaceae bacterium]
MSGLPALFRRKAREQHLDSELRFHLEQQSRDNIAAGMDPEEARRKAAIEFGGLEQIKEQCRDMRSGQWLETTLRDLRFGIRSLCRTPGFTIIALATIAVGIGANTAIFSFVDAVLIKPVPFPEVDRMVALGERDPKGNYTPFSTLTYLDWTKLASVFENIAAERNDEIALTGTEVPVRLVDDRVSAHYFDIFRVSPALGRTFVDGEDQAGRDGVAVLSNKLWASQFGSDAGVVGQTLLLDGKPTTVIGVLPPGVMDRIGPEVYRPLVFPPEALSRDGHWLLAYARLKAGVSVEQARAELDTISKRIAKDNPKSNKDWGAIIVPYAATRVWKELRQSLHVLQAAVGAVLMIACANLANLTLARGLARGREVAIRAALGAGRWRLVRQFLTESLLLSSAGGFLGVLVGYGAMAALKGTAMPASSLPYTADVEIDGRVLLFALGLSVLTGIVVGLIPALKASRPDIAHATKDGSPETSTGPAQQGLRGALVVTEVALAFILLSGAGLFIRSFLQIQKVDVGFDSTNLATAYLPIGKRFPSGTELNRYLHQIVERIGSIPGVTDVALATEIPRGRGWGDWRQIQISGTKATDPALRPHCGYKVVTPSYFHTLGMRLVRGR